jgi:hypothetical protein
VASCVRWLPDRTQCWFIRKQRALRVKPHIRFRRTSAGERPGYRLSVADADCDIGRFVIRNHAGQQAAGTDRFDQAGRQLPARWPSGAARCSDSGACKDHRPLTPQGRQEFDADSIAYAELTKAVVML